MQTCKALHCYRQQDVAFATALDCFRYFKLFKHYNVHTAKSLKKLEFRKTRIMKTVKIDQSRREVA